VLEEGVALVGGLELVGHPTCHEEDLRGAQKLCETSEDGVNRLGDFLAPSINVDLNTPVVKRRSSTKFKSSMTNFVSYTPEFRVPTPQI
jgi:hypothetical protein